MDWIPQDEAAHDALLNKYLTYANANTAPLGITVPKMIALNAANTLYIAKRDARRTYENQAAGIYQAARDAKEALHALWRIQAREVTSRQETTDEQRGFLGLTIGDDTPSGPPAPVTHPVITKIETPARLQHIAHWRDSGDLDSKRKPPGVKHAILLLQINGPAPTDPAAMQRIATDTGTPYLYEFDAADAGKIAHWAACWETTDGQMSGCGPVMSWTIPA